jgi:hypothetical protein
MKLFSCILLVLFLNACSKEKVDEKHYFISAFNEVKEYKGEKFPLQFRCEFILHLYQDSVQLYHFYENMNFYSEKIKASPIESNSIKRFLKEKVKSIEIARYPNKEYCLGIACYLKPIMLGSISNDKSNKFAYVNFENEKVLKSLINKLRRLNNGKFSSSIYKEKLFQNTYLEMSNYRFEKDGQRQIQFLPSVKE